MTTATPNKPQSNPASVINGVDGDAVRDLIETIKQDPREGMTRWSVSTQWTGGMASTTHARQFTMGGRPVERNFDIHIDEPVELGGQGTQANPQEHLMAALNACMGATYVALCTLHGITLDSLVIDVEGAIDLRGFLAIDPEVRPGYDEMRITFRVKSDADPEQLERIHQHVRRLSPNFFNLAAAIPLKSELVTD